MSKQTFEIAVPSYNRPELIRDRTLNFIQSRGGDLNRTTVFLHDEEQADLYGELPCKIVLHHGKSIGQARNFIHRYYPEGTRVLSLDDDTDKLKVLREGRDEYFIEEVSNLPETINSAFLAAEKVGAGLWGVYPVENDYFMDFRTYIKPVGMSGHTYGFISNHDPRLMVELDNSSEDNERVLLYQVFDRCCRINWLASSVKGQMMKIPGGLQGIRTEETIKKSHEFLIRKFPGRVSIDQKKVAKTGRSWIKFNRSAETNY